MTHKFIILDICKRSPINSTHISRFHKQMKSIFPLFCLFLFFGVNTLSPYKIINWNKTIIQPDTQPSNESQILTKIFSTDQGSYQMCEFSIQDSKIELTVADGSRSNYTKRLILTVWTDLTDSNREQAGKSQLYELRGVKSRIQVEQMVQTDLLEAHWLRHRYQEFYTWNYTYISNKQLIILSEKFYVSIKMKQFPIFEHFEEYDYIRNVCFSIFLLFLLYFIIVPFAIIPSQSFSNTTCETLYMTTWTIAIIPLIFLVCNFGANISFSVIWFVQFIVLILGRLYISLVIFLFMDSYILNKDDQIKKYAPLFIFHGCWSILLAFWFNWFSILVYTIIHVFLSFNNKIQKMSIKNIKTIESHDRSKYDTFKLQNRYIIIFMIAILFHSLLLLDKYNPGSILFEEISFRKFDISELELALMEVNFIVALLVPRKAIMTDSQRLIK